MNSTLQRIENLEKTVSKLEGQLATILALSTRVPALEQTLNSVNKNTQSLVEQANRQFEQQYSMIQTVANQNVALEQSQIKMGQIFTALSESLFESGVVESASVSDRLAKIQDEVERTRIKNMLAYKAIQQSETVGAQSIVVATETLKTKKEGEEEVQKQLSAYRVLEMGSQYNDQKIVAEFVGKKVGESVSVDVDGGTVLLTINEIYDLAQQIKSEEVAEKAVTEEVSTEQTPAT